MKKSQLLVEVDEDKYRAAFGETGWLTLEQLLTATQDDREKLVDIEIQSLKENEAKELDANGDGKIDFDGKLHFDGIF